MCHNFACAGNKNSKRYNWKFNSASLFTLNLAKITVCSCNFVTCWKERPSVYAGLRSFKFTRRNLIFEQEGSLREKGEKEKRAQAKLSQIFATVQSDSANCRHARRLCCDQPTRRLPQDGSFPPRSQRKRMGGWYTAALSKLNEGGLQCWHVHPFVTP